MCGLRVRGGGFLQRCIPLPLTVRRVVGYTHRFCLNLEESVLGGYDYTLYSPPKVGVSDRVMDSKWREPALV